MPFQFPLSRGFQLTVERLTQELLCLLTMHGIWIGSVCRPERDEGAHASFNGKRARG